MNKYDIYYLWNNNNFWLAFLWNTNSIIYYFHQKIGIDSTICDSGYLKLISCNKISFFRLTHSAYAQKKKEVMCTKKYVHK